MVEPMVSPRRFQWCFAAALMVAVSVRLYLLWQYYCISSDGVIYLRAARDFYSGNINAALSSLYPPGYPLLIAAVYPLFGHWEIAGQCLSLLFGVLLLFPLYRIFLEVFNERVALLACFLAGISPFLALYSVHVRSESTYVFLSTLALYLFLTAIEQDRKARMFWGGTVAGYAYLVRPEAIGFLAIVPVIALLRWSFRRRNIWAEFVPSLGVLGLGFLLLALPYIVYLSIDTGHLGAISRKAGITLAINLKESGTLETDDSQRDVDVDSFVFTDYIRAHPVAYAKKVFGDFIPAVGVFFEALHYSYVPFLLFGMFLAMRDKSWIKSEVLLLGFVFFYVFGFALIYVKRRYALQAVPISLGWVALGMWYGWDKLRTVFSAQKAALVGACAGLIFLGATLSKTLKPVSREKAYVRETGRYLRAHNNANDLRVAVFDDRVTFYAAAGTISLADIKQSELIGQLQRQKADYLAAESRAFQRVYPEIAKTPARYGLVLEKIFVGTRKDQMLLFRVV